MSIFKILCNSHNATNDDARYRDIVSHLDDDDVTTTSRDSRFCQLCSLHASE